MERNINAHNLNLINKMVVAMAGGRRSDINIVLLFVVTLSISLFPIMKSQQFDKFYFVQQWPPAVCDGRTGKCVGKGMYYFTIHGVWPQKGGKSVINCPGTQFDFNKVFYFRILKFTL